MKKLLLTLILICMIFISYSQFCGSATNNGILIPNLTIQTTPATGNGQRPYWTFTGVAGCTYTFQTCGLTSMDTELEILTSPGLTPLVYNDDACSTQSRLIWLCPTNGTYIIFITRYGFWGTCYNLNANVTMQYFNNCGGLPIELEYFEVNNITNANLIRWGTASEHNNDYFDVEWTTDPSDTNSWKIINKLDGANNSQELIEYNYVHKNYTRNSINYYRLTQVDYDGNRETFDIKSVDNTFNQYEILKVINTMGQTVDFNTKGVLFIIYTDGKIERIVNY